GQNSPPMLVAREARCAQNRGIRCSRTIYQHLSQERCKRTERHQVGMGVNRLTYARARRTVKHPGWDLKPTVCIRPAQFAAKNNAVRLADRLLNADPKTTPRMPSVQDFSKLGFVGVLKLCCTTRFDRTAASAVSRQPLTPTAALPTRNGTGRCATPGLRAPSRCFTEPIGL